MEKARQQNLLTFLIGCIGMLTWNHVYAMDEQPEHTQEASTMRLASQEIQITHDADAAVLEALLTDIRTKSGIYSILDDGDLFLIAKALKSCILPSISRFEIDKNDVIADVNSMDPLLFIDQCRVCVSPKRIFNILTKMTESRISNKEKEITERQHHDMEMRRRYGREDWQAARQECYEKSMLEKYGKDWKEILERQRAGMDDYINQRIMHGD